MATSKPEPGPDRKLRLLPASFGHDVDRHLAADEIDTHRHGGDVQISIHVVNRYSKRVFAEEAEGGGVLNSLVGPDHGVAVGRRGP